MRVVIAEALARGSRFLLARQGGDGLWRDFLTPAGEAAEWPTGFAATALLLAGAGGEPLERAASALIARQNLDGGWSYNEDVPSDADSTACVLLFLALMGHRGADCGRAAACLARHQLTESGGIATYAEPGPIRRYMGLGPWVSFRGWCRAHCEVTAAGGQALVALAEGPSPEAAAAWRYVQSQQEADGSWRSYWWTSPHYTTLQAVELGRRLHRRGAIARAAEWAIRGQRDDGGWSAPGAEASAFATALSLSILASVRAGRQPIERATRRLVELQQKDGGWSSHPIMRIPLPGERDPDARRRRRLIKLGGGIVVRDQHRTFTSAACVAALARTREALS